MLAHVERDPVVIAASDVEIGCLHAAADVDPAQFARQIDPAVVDVDRVVVGVPLDVERVEVTPRVGVAELVRRPRSKHSCLAHSRPVRIRGLRPIRGP